MSNILILGHTAITHFQHLGIIPMTWPGIRIKISHLVDDVEYSYATPVEETLVAISDIGSNAPQMSDTLTPFPRFMLAPFANTENHRSSRLLDCIAHSSISSLRILSLIRAPVILQVIYTPFGIHQSILKLMTTATRATLTGVASGTGIKSELQTLAMNIISQVFHSVRKAVRICLDEAKRVAFYLPAVINNNILVSRILHTSLHHFIRHIHNQLLADITAKLIP